MTLHGTAGPYVVTAWVAADDRSRAQGLRGAACLVPGAGMLFVFPSPRRATFTMDGMACAVDILWLCASGTVVGGLQSVPPGHRCTPPSPVALVLEAAAGTIARAGVRVGTRFAVTRG